MGLSHRFNENNSISFHTNFSKFDSVILVTGQRTDSTSNGLSVNFNGTLSDTWIGSASLGFATTKSEVKRPFFPPPFNQVKSDVTNFVGNIALTRSSEVTTWNFQLGQSITPNANGSEVKSLNARANAGRKFSQRLSGEIGVYGFDQQDANDLLIQNLDRQSFSVTAGLRWGLLKDWSLSGRYGFNYQRFTNPIAGPSGLRGESDSQTHEIFIGVQWRPPGWRF